MLFEKFVNTLAGNSGAEISEKGNGADGAQGAAEKIRKKITPRGTERIWEDCSAGERGALRNPRRVHAHTPR